MEEEPSEPAEPGSERRTSKRYTTRSLVEVRIPSWTALQAVYTVNLSLGGMRLSLGARVSMGAPVDIIMTLPDGERLHLPGKVAHLGPASDGDIGVRFDELSPTTRDEIKRYVDELASGRTPGPVAKTTTIPPGQLIKKKS